MGAIDGVEPNPRVRRLFHLLCSPPDRREVGDVGVENVPCEEYEGYFLGDAAVNGRVEGLEDELFQFWLPECSYVDIGQVGELRHSSTEGNVVYLGVENITWQESFGYPE